MLSLKKQNVVGLSVPQWRLFIRRDDHRTERPTEIDLSDLMKVLESDPILTTREVARKLRRTHSAIHC